MVCDTSGATGEKLREFMQTFNLFKMAESLRYRCKIVILLSLNRSLIAYLRAMDDFCGKQADYVMCGIYAGQNLRNFLARMVRKLAS